MRWRGMWCHFRGHLPDVATLRRQLAGGPYSREATWVRRAGDDWGIGVGSSTADATTDATIDGLAEVDDPLHSWCLRGNY